MPVRTTFQWPDPDDDPNEPESFSDSPLVEFTDAVPNHSGVVTESLNSLLIEFNDSNIEFTYFDQDDPT